MELWVLKIYVRSSRKWRIQRLRYFSGLEGPFRTWRHPVPADFPYNSINLTLLPSTHNCFVLSKYVRIPYLRTERVANTSHICRHVPEWKSTIRVTAATSKLILEDELLIFRRLGTRSHPHSALIFFPFPTIDKLYRIFFFKTRATLNFECVYKIPASQICTIF